MDDFDMLNAPAAGNGVGAEEDPAAAFLAQQECEIAGIENDEGFSILDSGDVPSSLADSSGGYNLLQRTAHAHRCHPKRQQMSFPRSKCDPARRQD